MKKWIALFCTLLLGLTLVSCGNSDKPTQNSERQQMESELSETEVVTNTEEQQEQVTDKQKDSDEEGLEVYYVTDDYASVKLISWFREEYPDIKLNRVLFSKVEDMDAQLAAISSTGKGPDVILFPSTTTLNVEEMASGGNFADLLPMLEADQTYDENNYYPVFNSGQINGKQFLMPLRLDCHYMISSKGKIQNAGIDVSTISSLMQGLMRTVETAEADACALLGGVNVYTWLRMTGVDILDKELEEISVSKELMQEYASFAQTRYKEIDKVEPVRTLYNNDFIQAFPLWTGVLANGSMPFIMRTADTYIKSGIEDQLQFVTYPNYEEPDTITADVILYAAVMDNSDEKESAFTFVRTLMDAALASQIKDIPISKAGTALLLDDLSKYGGKTFSVGASKITVQQMTPELRAECEAILDKIAAGSIRNHALESIITETMEPYILGEADFDSCYTKFKNQMEIYLYE